MTMVLQGGSRDPVSCRDLLSRLLSETVNAIILLCTVITLYMGDPVNLQEACSTSIRSDNADHSRDNPFGASLAVLRSPTICTMSVKLLGNAPEPSEAKALFAHIRLQRLTDNSETVTSFSEIIIDSLCRHSRYPRFKVQMFKVRKGGFCQC